MKVKCFEPVIDGQSQILILGTAPGGASLLANEYYAHGGNRFWPLMFDILSGSPNLNYEEKKQLLLNNRIALWDVISECDRKGSGDKAIQNEVMNDFKILLSKYPAIKTIILNGNNPKKFIDRHKVAIEANCFVVPSTSPINNVNYSFPELKAAWLQHLN